MSDDSSYQKLIDHIKNWVIPLPESELLLPIMKMRYTAEEAEFLSTFPLVPHSAKVLSRKLGIPIEELKEKLDGFARRGLMHRRQEKRKVYYNLAEAMTSVLRMPFWWERTEDWMYELAPLVNQYYINAMGAELTSAPKLQRAVPVNQSIKDERGILPHDDVLKLMDNVHRYAVTTCSCRHRHNIDPAFEKSKFPTRTCLHFDDLASYIIEMGIGEEITKEETLKILKDAADAGCVHGLDNAVEGYTTICNCSPDACLFLEKVKGDVPRGQHPSNYIREIEEEKCIACGLCVKRCPTEALELIEEEKKVNFIPEKCIGCGVCVIKCPTEAIWLERREEIIDYPPNFMEIASRKAKTKNIDIAKIIKENML